MMLHGSKSKNMFSRGWDVWLRSGTKICFAPKVAADLTETAKFPHKENWIGCVERYFWTSFFLVWLLVRERKWGRNTGMKCICLDVQFTCLGCRTWKFTQIPHLKLCKLSWSKHGWQTRGSEHQWLPNKMNLGRQQFHRFIINQKKSTCKSTRVFGSLFSVAVAPRNTHQESILWFKTCSC
jgi:hypothetical protein